MESVNVTVSKSKERLQAEVHWTGGEVTPIELSLPRRGQHGYVTDKEVIELLRRLAREFDDTQISIILGKRGITTSKGNRFSARRVARHRRNYGIPRGPGRLAKRGPNIYTAQQAGQLLGVTNATIVRWIHVGLIRGTQVAPGAPWRVQITDEDRKRLTTEDAPQGWWSLKTAAVALGVTQQTVLNRLAEGQLEGVRVQHGRRTSWRIRPIDKSSQCQGPLFE